MDYIFRWLNLRFLSGTQLTLFADLGLRPAHQLPASPSLLHEGDHEEDALSSQQSLARLAEEVARRLNEISGQSSHSGSAPAGSSAPELQSGGASYGSGTVASIAASQHSTQANTPENMSSSGARDTSGLGMQDRGIYHPADAMRDLYDMGDAPSCSTCGAIMVRNGSCYRCMSCGSTSGCS
jgi:ribonucleoside-diphosphate reductase alpha chain